VSLELPQVFGAGKKGWIDPDGATPEEIVAICEKCPVGIATQDPALRKLVVHKKAVDGFVNYYNATKTELENIARSNGKNDLHQLDTSDILTLSDAIAKQTGIEHV
jgi:hypothetical protein